MRVCAAPPFDNNAPRATDARWRAHDLLRIVRLAPADDEPEWVGAALARAPWAVVRRARTAAGFVAVGVRGSGRAQRFGAWINAQDVESFVAPEALSCTAPMNERAALPAFVALAALRDTPSVLHEFAWGPTGSAGFELATRAPTLTDASDLDLLIRVPQRCRPDVIGALVLALGRAAQRADTRVDAQLETPAGGVALAELAAGKPHVLARSDDGPRLVADPWRIAP